MRRAVLEFWKRRGLFGRGSNLQHDENGSAGPHPTPGAPHLPKRRLLLERLEERLLFDAGPQAPSDIDMEMANEQSMQSSAIADVLDARLIEPAETRPAMTSTDAASPGTSDLVLELSSEQVIVSALDPNVVAEPIVGTPVNADALAAELLMTADEQHTELRTATTHLRREIVFVDPTIRNLPELLAGISPDAEVVLFDSTRDGVEQIAERLAGRTGLSAIHILSHGSDATAQLGTATLNADSIQGQYAETLQQIGQALAEEGDLLMYGCNFGAGAEGRRATAALALATGADVATSTNATGHRQLGGDWELEQQIGLVETAVVVSFSTQVEWVGLLPTTVSRTSTPVFYIDLGDSLDSAYASYQITNSDGVDYSDVWVTIGSFTGGVVSANANEDRVMHLGALANGATKAAFFYLTATGITAVDQGHTINVYSGSPSAGTLISSQSFVFTDVVTTIAANANKVTTVVSGPNPAELGGIMTITVTGETGTIGAAEVMAFTPATFATWRADAFELIGTTITLSAPNAGTFTDTLLIPPAALTSGANTPYVNVYTFKAVGSTAAPTIVSPVGYISSGTQVKHTDTGGFIDGSFPPIQPAQNMTTLSKLSSVNSLHGGGAVTYTLRLTNTGTSAVSLEQFVDTLPGGVSYVIGSSTFNGVAFANPTISGQTLTWTGTFTVAAGSTADLVFTATLPDINAAYVNQAVAWIGSTQIDTTLDTTDNAPATKSVAVVNAAPIAVDDSYAFNEDTPINISLPGVLGNDSDADGDALTVTILSGPANGTVTLNANGSFNFTPTANFNGSDTFIYQVADGHGGSDTATVTLTGVSINDPPAGADRTRTIAEDTTYIFAATDFGFSDPLDVPANAFLEVVITTLPSATEGVLRLSGVPLTAGQIIPAAQIGNLTFTPFANLSGTGLGLFTFQVRDNGGTANGGGNTDTTPNSFNFNITPINDVPTGGNRTVTTVEDTNYAFTLADFPYSDVETASLAQVRIDTLPAAGSVLLNGSPVVAAQVISAANIAAGQLVFQPAADANGSPYTTFTFSVGDGTAFTAAPSTMTINVTPVVDITADSLTTTEDTPLSFNPITGTNGATADSFEAASPTITAINGTAISVGGNVAVTNGTVSLAAGNVLTFTPSANFNGSVPAFTYTVSSGGLTETANINITVTSVNDPPVADDETFMTGFNESVIIPVLTGDTDQEGDTLTVTQVNGTAISVGSPVAIATGVVSLNVNGTLTFTPNLNYSGPAAFDYTVSDGNGGSDTGNVSGTVRPPNNPPVADDEIFAVAEDGSVIIPVLLGDTDLDGDTLTVTHIDGFAISIGSPITIATGLVSLNPDGTLTFAPNANYNGPASFDYTVSDGNGGTDIGNASGTVTPVNDAPIADDETFTVAEDGSVIIPVLLGDTDLDGDTLAVTHIDGSAISVGSPVTIATGLVSLNADGTLTFTPNADFNGPTAFDYRVSDGNGGTDIGRVSGTVTAVVDITADSLTTNEDTPLSFNPITGTNGATADSFEAAGPTIIAINGTSISVGNSVAVTNGSVSLAVGNVLTFTPAANFNGAVPAFSYTVSSGGVTETANINVNVLSINDPPVADDESFVVAEDGSVIIPVLLGDTDLDGDTLTVTEINGFAISVGSPITIATGLVSLNADGTLTFTPNANFNGPASFDYTVSDGNGGTDFGNVSGSVTPVNDPPIADDETFVVAEDGSVIIPVLLGDTDLDGDTLTVTEINGFAISVGSPITIATGVVSLNADGTLTFTPNANFNGPASFDYTVSDGNGGTDFGNVSGSVTPVNDPPIADDETFVVAEDGSVIIPVLLGDTDLDGDTLTVTEINGFAISVGSPITIATGVVSLNADGTLTFSPNANYNGPAAFDYTVSDGNGSTDIGNVSGTVTPTNDPPVADDESVTTDEDTPIVIDVVNGDVDLDGTIDPTSVIIVSTPPGAMLSVDGKTLTVPGEGEWTVDLLTGEITFTPELDYQGPVTTITYEVADDLGATDTADVSLSLNSINDAPTGGDCAVTTPEDTDFVFAASDFPFNDVDGDPLAAVRIETLPSDGTLLLNGIPVTAGDVISVADINGGLLLFRPVADETGSPYTTFEFSVGDGLLFSVAPNTMTVNVTPTVVTIAKSYFDSSDGTTVGNNVTIGETVTFALLVSLSEGSTSDLIVVDELPDGLQYVGLTLVSTAAGSGGLMTADFAGTFPAPVTTGCTLDGEDVTFTFGMINITVDGDSTNNSFVILVQALVTDVPSNSGLASSSTTLTNVATADVSNPTPPTSSTSDVTIVEPQIEITKTASIATGDAGDIVTYTLTIQHTSESTGVAHDIVISDLLTDSDLLLVAGSVDASLGSVSGIISIGNTSGDTTVSVDVSQLALGETVIVSFQVIVQTSAVMDESADNSATADWDSLGGPNGRTGSDSDEASVDIAVPTITKTLVSTGIISATNSLTEATIGEFVQYELVITLPEGTLPAAFVIDNLDEGLEFVRLDLIDGYRNGFPAVGVVTSSRGTLSDTGLMTPTITGTGTAGDPQTLTFDLGTITNSDTDNAEPETLVIRYTVKVANIVENQGNGPALGSLRDNSAHLEWTANAATSATAIVSGGPIEVIEPELQAIQTASITTGDAFDPITYTITVSHTANSETDAFDVSIDDLIPANINVTSIVATHSTLGDVSSSFAMLFSSIYTVSGQAIDLLLGETLTLVINGTLPADIQPGQTVTNNAIVSWTSLDDNAPLDGDDFAERNGLGGGVQDYAVTATAPTLTVPNATFDKTFVTTGLNSGTNSATAAVIGETVRYRLLVTLPEGTTNLAHILDTLDLGLSFDRIVSVTGYSGGAPSLDISSSQLDFTPTLVGDGLSSAQQLTFKLGTLSNLDADNVQVEQFEIIYDAIVLNSATNQGADSPSLPTTLGNSAHFEWDLFSSTQATASSDASDIEVIEPLLNVTMLLSDTTPNLGDVVTFTLTITHAADSDTDAFDVRLLDLLPAGLTLGLGSINAVGATIASDSSADNTLDIVLDQVPHGGTVTVTFNATVTSTVSDIGLALPNNLDMTWTSLPGTSTAERDGDAPLGIDDYADADSTNATVVNPELSVTIDNMLTIVAPNQTLTYSIVVTNDGNSDATGLTLTSTLPIDRVTFVSTDDAANVTFDSGTGLLTWTPAVGSLSPAGTLTLLLTVQVNPTVPAGADNVTVSASVTHNNIEPTPANNTSSDTDPLDAAPDLSVTKSDLASSATPGTSSVYTINIANVGNQGATNVLVTETVPIGTTFDSVLSDPLWTLTAPNTYQLLLPSFAAGSSLNFSFAVTVNSPALAGQNDIVNSATITDDGTNGSDPNPCDNSTTDTNTLDAAPDYAITISDGKSQVRPGESLTYHVTVTNHGNQNGTGVVVSDTFPPGILQNVVASDGGVVDSLTGTITWSVGNLAVNCSITFTVTAKVRTGIDPSTKDFTHSTSVTDDLMNGLDPTPCNNLAADTDALFFYSFDSFHNWREPQFAAFFPQASEVGRPLPPLPVDPIFSGLTEPGTTLVGRIYDSQGRVMGERQVVADSGGNWLMTFPNVLIFEHPHRMEIIVTPAISNSAHENGFNLRRYFHPAIHTELYCNEQMSVSGVFRNRAFNIIDAMHSSNTRPLGFDWFSHAYELTPASTNVANQ